MGKRQRYCIDVYYIVDGIFIPLTCVLGRELRMGCRRKHRWYQSNIVTFSGYVCMCVCAVLTFNFGFRVGFSVCVCVSVVVAMYNYS